MNIHKARVILTGAAGGIGSRTAAALASAGTNLLLVDRQAEPLQGVAAKARAAGVSAFAFPADLTQPGDRSAVVEQAGRLLGGIDILISSAGLLDFTPFEAEDPQAIERLLGVNLVAPILLCRAVLPRLLEQGAGRLVNIGSVYGLIGFPYFAAYSASKFALRGFSEALRRELSGTGVGVTHIAPRATRTGLNTSAINRMNDALKVRTDSPTRVADAILDAIRRDRDDVCLGWPESFFARLNGVLPGVVGGALSRQGRTMRKYALGSGM